METPSDAAPGLDVTQGPQLVTGSAVDTPAEFQALIQTMVNNVNKLIASSTVIGCIEDLDIYAYIHRTWQDQRRISLLLQVKDRRSLKMLSLGRWRRVLGSLRPSPFPILAKEFTLRISPRRQVCLTIRAFWSRTEKISSETGVEAATIIERHRGSKKNVPSLTINFNISQEDLDSITKWNERAKHSAYVASRQFYHSLTLK